MAFYDVNAAIDKPNLWGSFQQGRQQAQTLQSNALALKAAQQQQADQNALRTLAPGVISGDPNAYDQAAAIDPDAATKYSNAADSQLRRLKGAVDYIESAKASGNMQAVEAAYQQVRPWLAKMGNGQQPPATFAEAEPQFEAAKARIAMLASGPQGRVQSTYIDAQGNRVAIMADGSTQVLGQNAPNNQILPVMGEDGKLHYYGVNKGSLNGAEVMVGGQQQAPQAGAQFAPSDPNDAAIASINAGLTQQGLPPMTPQQEQQVRSSMANGTEFKVGASGVSTSQAPSDSAPVPQQAPGALLPALDYQNGGNLPRPLVGAPKPISPAEQQRLDFAAQASRRADEAAQRAAQIAQRGTAPAGYRFRADGSLEPIPGAPKPAASAGAETQKQAVYAKNMAEDAYAFAAAFTGIPAAQLKAMSPEQVRQAMLQHDRATAGPVLGSIPGMGKFANADLEAYSNSAAGKQARINNPTGPVTNADFEVARKSVFSSDKPRKVNADLVYEALVRAQQGGQQPSADNGVDDLLSKYGVK